MCRALPTLGYRAHGTVVGLLIPSLTAAAVFGLFPQRFGVGSAVNQSIRQMGAVFGVALVLVLVGNRDRRIPGSFPGADRGRLATALRPRRSIRLPLQRVFTDLYSGDTRA